MLLQTGVGFPPSPLPPSSLIPGLSGSGPSWGGAASCRSAEPLVPVLPAASRAGARAILNNTVGGTHRDWMEMGTPGVGQPWLFSWLLPVPWDPQFGEGLALGVTLALWASWLAHPHPLAPEPHLPFLVSPPACSMIWGLMAACVPTPAGLCTGSSPHQEHPFSHFHWADAGHAPSPGSDVISSRTFPCLGLDLPPVRTP